jgi:energy-coupling factor transporter ATP-binding protein EcfA2
VQDALGTLSGIARFEGREYPVHTRLARLDDRLYLDLADEQWRVVEVDPTGWRVLNTAPVKFRRPKGMLPLPVPVKGGDIQGLRQFVNVDEVSWPLVLGWLVACYAPSGPYPILVLTAEQGSGKSTTARVLRELIDPNQAPLRSEPRDDRDVMIAARNGAVIMLDNLSRVEANLSDSLCRLATGGGFGTRELYSNDDETLFNAMLPVLLTGIEELATRGDLLDRSILGGCPRLESYHPERELWESFKQAAPSLLGALLTAVSTGLKNLPTTTLPNLPRMADATLWVTACEPALGFTTGTFANAYLSNRREAHDLVLEGSPLPGVLRDLLTGKEVWEGTATELLNTLTSRVDPTTQGLKGWPRTARALTNALRRLAPNLRATGVAVEFAKTTGGKRLIRIVAQPIATIATCATNIVADAKDIVAQDATTSPLHRHLSPLRGASGVASLDIATTSPLTEVRPGQQSGDSGASGDEIPNHSDGWTEVI